MSTSSSYSSNKLLQVIDDKTQHFIAKSYITAIFESDRYITEYHLYWYNKNKGTFEEDDGYVKMSYKQMNKNEIRFFFSIEDNYKIVLENKHGFVYNDKSLVFDKSKVILSQFSIDF